MEGGPSRGSDLVGRKFQFGYFLGGIFGGEIVYLFFIFSERKINQRYFLRNKSYKYSFFGDLKINDIIFTNRG